MLDEPVANPNASLNGLFLGALPYLSYFDVFHLVLAMLRLASLSQFSRCTVLSDVGMYRPCVAALNKVVAWQACHVIKCEGSMMLAWGQDCVLESSRLVFDTLVTIVLMSNDVFPMQS